MTELKYWKGKKKRYIKKKLTVFVQCRGKHFGLDYLLQFRFDISLQDIQIKKTIPEQKLCLEIKTYLT